MLKIILTKLQAQGSAMSIRHHWCNRWLDNNWNRSKIWSWTTL